MSQAARQREPWSYPRYWSLLVGELTPEQAVDRYGLRAPLEIREWIETREADELARIDEDAWLPAEWQLFHLRALVELTAAADAAACDE
jgi:hypothetical protein